MTRDPDKTGGTGQVRPRRELTDAARRALAEASDRRAQAAITAHGQPIEIGGRGDTEPVRYGDWEVKGIATDF